VSINNDPGYHVYILMYTISIEIQPTMKINIHNQCSNFKLKDKRMFNNCLNWNRRPNDEVDANSMTSGVSTSSWATFESIVIYRLQRKSVESDDQLKSTYTLLFIVWKSEGYKKFSVFVQLIDCDKTFSWRKIDQEEYYQRYASQLSTYTGPVKDTWLLSDGTVLMTKLDLGFMQRDGVLTVTISNGVKDDHTKIPKLIDPKM
jgi:TRAP-type uncharacterized transport system substrate-binding protein